MNFRTVHRGPDRRKSDRRDTGVKESYTVIYRRYVIARLYVVLSAMTTIFISMFEPKSINFYYLINGSIGGKIIIFCNIALVATALIDSIVNDFMGNKYKIMFLYHWRHLLYMAIAMGLYAQSAAIILTNHNTSFILARLWLDGFIAALIAVLDIFVRYNKDISWHFGK